MSSSNQNRKDWYEPWFRLRRGAVELIAHGAMLALILLIIKGIESVDGSSLGEKEKLLFGVLPVRYAADGADLVLPAVFLTIGIWAILSAYSRKRGE
jgi:hypothetical protein